MAHFRAPLALLSFAVNLKPIVRSKDERNQLYLSGCCFEIRAYSEIIQGESEKPGEFRNLDVLISREPHLLVVIYYLEMCHKLCKIFVFYQSNLKHKFPTNIPAAESFSYYM